MSRGLSPCALIHIPNGRLVLTLDNSPFSVMWQLGPRRLVVVEEGRGDGAQRTLSGSPSHYEVLLHRTERAGMFLWTALLVTSNWSTTRTEALAGSHYGAASEGMGTWSNKCNPSSSVSMLWCPHLLCAQQLAASCLLPVSISQPPSCPSSQCLWLPRVPMTVFLQSFLFILGLPSYPGSELYKREIPVVWQEN